MIKLIGMTCFSVESIPLLFPILNRMKKKENFNKYFVTVSATAITFTSIMGCIIYKTMGNNMTKIYLETMINDYKSIKILLLLYALFLFLNMNYINFPTYQIIFEERKLFSKAFDVSYYQL